MMVAQIGGASVGRRVARAPEAPRRMSRASAGRLPRAIPSWTKAGESPSMPIRVTRRPEATWSMETGCTGVAGAGAGRIASGITRAAAGATTVRAAESERTRLGKSSASTAIERRTRRAMVVTAVEAARARSASTGIEWR